MIVSQITGKTYNPDNDSCVYITNMVQSYKYLNAIGSDYLLDILYAGTKHNCLVFVFKKCAETAECFKKWMQHEL